MILFHHIVQILAGAAADRILPSEIELIPHAHPPQCRMGRLESIERDGPRLTVALQRFAEECLWGRDIARPTEMRLHGFAPFIHCAVQIHPSRATLNVRFVAAPW
jgi:hypothetical protein